AVLRKVVRARRDADAEPRALSEATVDLDRSAVELHQIADQREPDPGSLVGATLGPADAMESLEDVRQLILRDADPRVLHRQHDGLVTFGERHRYAALERELERIRQEIQDDLLPHVPVDKDRGPGPVADHAKRQTCPLDGGAEDARELARQICDVDRLEDRLRSPRFDPREVEERVHETQQPQAVSV